MKHSSSKCERVARKLGVSIEAVEQYLQLKRIEVAAEEEAPARPVEPERQPPRPKMPAG